MKPKLSFYKSNVFLLGLVSFFIDISTQMVYYILPLYLINVLGATPTIIGIIEGFAESVASIIKMGTGIFADKYGKKKQLAFIGYATVAVNKILILLASTWGWVFFAKLIEKLGKGIRTAPRDALIAESADKSQLGRAYGLHKGMDLLGTAIGILLAYFLWTDQVDAFKKIIIYSIIPAIIGVTILLLVKDNQKPMESKKFKFEWRTLDKRLKYFLAFIFIFTLGNSSNAFIMLRSTDVGFDVKNAILLFFLYNVVGSIFSKNMGKISDKIGRKKMLCSGYFLYAVAYFGIAFFINKPLYIAMFVLYGLYTAIATGTERAQIVEIIPENQKASALGLYAAIVGIGILPANFIAGILWDVFGQTTPFYFSGVMALIACVGVGCSSLQHKCTGWQDGAVE